MGITEMAIGGKWVAKNNENLWEQYEQYEKKLKGHKNICIRNKMWDLQRL